MPVAAASSRRESKSPFIEPHESNVVSSRSRTHGAWPVGFDAGMMTFLRVYGRIFEMCG
jgi:hypothetical protein